MNNQNHTQIAQMKRHKKGDLKTIEFYTRCPSVTSQNLACHHQGSTSTSSSRCQADSGIETRTKALNYCESNKRIRGGRQRWPQNQRILKVLPRTFFEGGWAELLSSAIGLSVNAFDWWAKGPGFDHWWGQEMIFDNAFARVLNGRGFFLRPIPSDIIFTRPLKYWPELKAVGHLRLWPRS